VTYRPTYANIDLKAISYNFTQIKKRLKKPTKTLVVVKADAYGHGILEISKRLVDSGVDYLGVATTDEAILLRKSGFKSPVLIMASVFPNEIEVSIKKNITLTVADQKHASSIDRYAERLKKKAKVHLKIDVGMGRIGMWHQEALSLIRRINRLKYIDIEGIFTHFPKADEDDLLTKKQISDFALLIEKLKVEGIDPKYKHTANSIAIVDYKDSHMNLVRPGLMLYGLYPSTKEIDSKIKLKPALSLISKIAFIKNVPAGRAISYGGTYITKCHTKIATIPIGYADGLSRRLSNKGNVLIRGKRAPIVGLICMDQAMIDISHISGARVGDEVVLIGRQKNGSIRAEEAASLCDTIPYEIVCSISKRVPRIFN